MKWILVATLQSPYFVYRTQGGAGATDGHGRVRLDAFELAAKLSYALWGTMPDQTLTDAAASGKLATNDGVAKIARSMLSDARALPRLADFHDELFDVAAFRGVERNTTLFPKYYPAFATDAQEDVRRTVRTLVLEDHDGDVANIFASRTAFVNAPLAAVYGIDPATVPGLVEHPQTFVRVTMDPAQRAGILTHVGWLAMQGKTVDPSTIMRGVYMARHILCVPLAARRPVQRARIHRRTINRPTASASRTRPRAVASGATAARRASSIRSASASRASTLWGSSGPWTTESPSTPPAPSSSSARSAAQHRC